MGAGYAGIIGAAPFIPARASTLRIKPPGFDYIPGDILDCDRPGFALHNIDLLRVFMARHRAVLPQREIFIDPVSGRDDNPGTRDKPLKSLKNAEPERGEPFGLELGHIRSISNSVSAVVQSRFWFAQSMAREQSCGVRLALSRLKCLGENREMDIALLLPAFSGRCTLSTALGTKKCSCGGVRRSINCHRRNRGGHKIMQPSVCPCATPDVISRNRQKSTDWKSCMSATSTTM